MDDLALARAARLEQEPMRRVNRPAAPFRGFLASVQGIWERRDLLALLTRREIKARYKDSTLGLVWSFIRPLVSLLIYYIAIGKFLEAERSIPDFAIYVFTGLTIWQFFSEMISSGTAAILANGGIIKKIQLPREIFPLASLGSALFNFAIQLGILLVAALLIRGLNPASNILFVPVGIIVLVLWGLAFMLILSAANVYWRDIQYLVEVGLMVGFWVSPIVYSWEMVQQHAPGWVTQLYLWNPVTIVVLAFQSVFWRAGADKPYPDGLGIHLLVMLAVGCIVLVIAQRIFDRLQRNFAQEM